MFLFLMLLLRFLALFLNGFWSQQKERFWWCWWHSQTSQITQLEAASRHLISIGVFVWRGTSEQQHVSGMRMILWMGFLHNNLRGDVNVPQKYMRLFYELEGYTELNRWIWTSGLWFFFGKIFILLPICSIVVPLIVPGQVIHGSIFFTSMEVERGLFWRSNASF